MRHVLVATTRAPRPPRRAARDRAGRPRRSSASAGLEAILERLGRSARIDAVVTDAPEVLMEIFHEIPGRDPRLPRAPRRGRGVGSRGSGRADRGGLTPQALPRPLPLRPHLGLEAAEAVGVAVHEAAPRGEAGVDLLDPPPHLLHDEPVVRVALRHRAQLAEVHGLAQVQRDAPAHAERERDDVLRLVRVLAGDGLVELVRLVPCTRGTPRRARTRRSRAACRSRAPS